MGISACIIAKNEEGNIERCLNSIKKLADEIIVVDTGSSDGTVEIARKFTENVFKLEWKDNHSEAKNFALGRATKEWILSIDADETISKKDYKRIKELTDKKEFLGFSLIQRNYTNNTGEFEWVSSINDEYEEGKTAYGYVPRRIVRLFRNDKRIRFEGVVHDNVGNSILRIGKILDTNIPVHHFGSLNPNPEKIRRYIETERKNIKDNFLQYCQIGVQLHSIGENEEAEMFLRKSIEKKSDFPFSYIELGAIMLEKERLEEAGKMLHKAESLTNNPMVYDYLGILYGMRGEYGKSIDYFKKALSMIPGNADFHYNLGLVYSKAGMKDDAVQEMKIAVTLNPEYSKKVRFY